LLLLFYQKNNFQLLLAAPASMDSFCLSGFQDHSNLSISQKYNFILDGVSGTRVAVSCELHHSYVFIASHDVPHSYEITEHFNILYLPIIWTVLASIFIYTGLKKEHSRSIARSGLP
jgi:hypothetical protein